MYALIQNNTIRQVGATVTHAGRVWESTVAGERSNTWAPGAYGWKDIGPA